MTVELISKIKSITGLSTQEADRTIKSFLDENSTMIASLVSSHVMAENERSPIGERTSMAESFLYQTLDEALIARYNLFNVPVSFSYRRDEQKVARPDFSIYYQLCILSSYVYQDGRYIGERFLVVHDMLRHPEYDYSPNLILSPMLSDIPTQGIGGDPSSWMNGDMSPPAHITTVEWYDDSFVYHVTSEYPAGSNIYRYRTYD